MRIPRTARHVNNSFDSIIANPQPSFIVPFEEWEKNHHEGTSTAIPLEHLIDAVGRSKDKDAILRDAEEKAFFDKMFARKK